MTNTTTLSRSTFKRSKAPLLKESNVSNGSQVPESTDLEESKITFSPLQVTDRTLQRLRTTDRPEISGLYLHQSSSEYHNISKLPLVIEQGESVSTDTYFNAFFVSNYRAYSQLNRFELKLKASGIFRLQIACRFSNGAVHLLHEEIYSTKGDETETIDIDIPLEWNRIQPSRIFYRIESLSNVTTVHGAQYLSKDAPKREHRTAIIIRTFKRKNDVTELIRLLLADPDISTGEFRVFVLDGGNDFGNEDLEEFKGKPISFYLADNYGSSGALNRAWFAFQEMHPDFDPTSIVVLDDDIFLDTESVFRCAKLFAYANDPDKILISGTMMSRSQPQQIESVVGRYSMPDPLSAKGYEPLSVGGTWGGQNATDLYTMDLVTKPVAGDCAAFYLLAFTPENFGDGDLVSPYYIKVDDIDFTYSLHKKGVSIVGFPGVAAWHDPFYMAMPVWQQHMELRHFLICDSVHRDFSASQLWKRISDEVKRYLLCHNYTAAEMMLESVDLFIEGPSDDFVNNYKGKNEAAMKSLIDRFKMLLNTSKSNSIDVKTLHEQHFRCHHDRKMSLNLRRIYRRALNGNKAPVPLKKDHFAVVDAIWPVPDAALGFNKVWHFNIHSELKYLCEHDASKGKFILKNLAAKERKFLRRFKASQAAWRARHTEFKSGAFWHSVFENEQNASCVDCSAPDGTQFKPVS